jgi:GxxExxY protein
LEDSNELTEPITGCSIEVHRHLGPGLLGATSEEALCREFADSGLRYRRQVPFPILYQGKVPGAYRLDFLAKDAVIVEVKSVEREVHAQIRTYRKEAGKKVGLLMNFHTRLMDEGIQGFVP